jgi:hypothetical protein
MASNDPFPAGRTSNGSPGDYEDDDSMVSIKGEGDDKKYDMGLDSPQVSNIRRGFIKIKTQGSDMLNALKDGAGFRAEKLCTTCKKIPFAECLPDDAEEDDEGTDHISPAQDALISYTSLSRILVNRAFCKFCNLLFRSICEPEYDLLKAQHIKKYLPDGDKYKDMKSFSDWIERNTYWKRE